MPYPKFLAFNALGGLAWGTAVVVAGYLAGESYARVEKAVGRGAALVVLAIVVVALLMWRIRKHQAEANNNDTGPSGSSRRA
jgi:membrane protein DedA with SNARE-associated domain